MRASIDAGQVMQGSIFEAFPFGNTIVRAKSVSGKLLRQVFEFSAASYNSGGFLQVSGATYSVDLSRPAGHRLVRAVLPPYACLLLLKLSPL